MLITKEDVGRKVCSIETDEWYTITSFVDDGISRYPVVLNNGSFRIAADGRLSVYAEKPTFFWDKVEIVEPPKPKRLVKKTFWYVRANRTSSSPYWLGEKIIVSSFYSNKQEALSLVSHNIFYDGKLESIELEVEE